LVARSGRTWQHFWQLAPTFAGSGPRHDAGSPEIGAAIERHQRVDQLAAYAELGLDRLIAFPCLYGTGPEPQERLADDCRSAGIALA
jgi:hypothetical protein